MDKHKYSLIYMWKKRGVISEDYNKLYENHMNINNCELCNVEFDNIVHNNKRCLDHDHNTGLYRQTICHKCNINFDRKNNKMRIDNTSGYKNICYHSKQHYWIYRKMINGKTISKSFNNLEDAISFSLTFS